MAEDNVYEITTYVDNSPAGMMRTVLEAGKDLEKMEKWLDLQIRWEENEAKKAYHKAMAAFKSNPPEIGKDRHVSFDTQKGKTEYNHASLFTVRSDDLTQNSHSLYPCPVPMRRLFISNQAAN